MTNLYNEFLKDDKYFKKLDIFRDYCYLIKKISQIYQEKEEYYNNSSLRTFLLFDKCDEEVHIAIKKNMQNIKNFLDKNITGFKSEEKETILKTFLLLQKSIEELEKDCTKEYKERIEQIFLELENQ